MFFETQLSQIYPKCKDTHKLQVQLLQHQQPPLNTKRNQRLGEQQLRTPKEHFGVSITNKSACVCNKNHGYILKMIAFATNTVENLYTSWENGEICFEIAKIVRSLFQSYLTRFGITNKAQKSF